MLLLHYISSVYLNFKLENYFILVNALKKTTEYFLKFRFYLKVESFRLITVNNFIQMAASAGHAVFHQWLHEYCPLKHQLSLACRRNTYL